MEIKNGRYDAYTSDKINKLYYDLLQKKLSRYKKHYFLKLQLFSIDLNLISFETGS